MSLFQRSAFPEPPIPPVYQGGSIALGGSPEERAMRLSAVWSCVRLLADSVSMMPVGAFTMQGGVRVPMSHTPQILKQPAAFGTFADWVYQIMASLVLTGNVYGLVVGRTGGYPSQIELLHPNAMHMKRNDDGTWGYYLGHIEKDPSDVFHVAAYLMPGSPVGLSPVAYAASTLATAEGAQAFGKNWFQNGGHPSGIVVAPTGVNKDQAKIIKDRMRAAVKDNDFAVLGGGVTWSQVQVAPEESQFLETQRFSANQIAQIFGVPPEMIGGDAGTSMSYANVTQRAMDFLTYSVQPWINRLESAFATLLPAAQHLRFDTSALVRLDAETQWIVNQAKINTAAETVNGIRSDSGKPPVAWGDTPYLPGIKNASAGMAIRFGEEAGSGQVSTPVPAAKPGATAPDDSKDDSSDETE